MGTGAVVRYRTRMMTASVLLLLCLDAVAAPGWSGRQTTTPVDQPADIAETATDVGGVPVASVAVSAVTAASVRPAPEAPDASVTETAARWGVTGSATPNPADAAPVPTTTAAWGAAELPPYRKPGSEPDMDVEPEPEPPGPVNRATDYTAYTLELGEVRLGLAQVGIGVAPRVQLTATPLLYALGAWNGAAKANLLRAGPWDMALLGSVSGLTEGRDFQALWSRVAMQHSVQAGERVGLHLGAGWDHIFALGLPSEQALERFIWDEDRARAYRRWYDTAAASDARFEASQNLVTLRMAVDFRLTERDAIVAQASGFTYGDARSTVAAGPDEEVIDLPPVLGLDEIFINESNTGNALAQSWVAGLAYQATFRHLQLRVGGGWSAQTWAWVPATFDASWRFGGRSRRLTRPTGTETPGPG